MVFSKPLLSLANCASLDRKLKLVPNFITLEDETRIMSEVEKRLGRLKYERGHWDEAIVGYREFESSNWSPETSQLIDRVRKVAEFKNSPRQLVHILDIEETGYIKPHIDSERSDLLRFVDTFRKNPKVL